MKVKAIRIWVCFFILALQSSISNNMIYCAYAGFSSAYILSTIIGGVLQLPIAKTLNLWGRAGYTLYWICYSAVNFILVVFIADASGLRNRAFAYAFIGTPSICTAFVGPLAAQAFYTHSTWRWAYGCFAIIIFFTFVPLALVFKFYGYCYCLSLRSRLLPCGRTIMLTGNRSKARLSSFPGLVQ